LINKHRGGNLIAAVQKH